jgi:hypothetical protein
VADYRTLGVVALPIIAPLALVDALVADERSGPELVREATLSGIRVVIAKT